MPQNIYEAPERISSSDPIDRIDEILESIIPKDRKKTYEMRKLLNLLQMITISLK